MQKQTKIDRIPAASGSGFGGGTLRSDGGLRWACPGSKSWQRAVLSPFAGARLSPFGAYVKTSVLRVAAQVEPGSEYGSTRTLMAVLRAPGLQPVVDSSAIYVIPIGFFQTRARPNLRGSQWDFGMRSASYSSSRRPSISLALWRIACHKYRFIGLQLAVLRYTASSFVL